MKSAKILIVGGGNAGLSVAAQLINQSPELNISIIEPSENHYYQPAWTLVGAGIFDVKKTEKDEVDYIPKGVNWIKDEAVSFLPESNTVNGKSGSAYTYDALVVAPGIQLDFFKIKGLKETLGKNKVSCNYLFDIAPYTWEIIKNFEGGTAVFTSPQGPVKCGGAPHKIMYLACDYWRKKGILDKCDVHYLTGSTAIFDVKDYAVTLEEVVTRNNIKVHFGVNVTGIDTDQRTVQYEEVNKDNIKETKSIHFDICHAVPPQSAPDFIKSSPLADPKNAFGFVEIDKHTMQHKRYSNVFALGDCTNAPAKKTGAAIRKQAPVVVENILSYIHGNPLSATYDGYSACPIPTQYGKLMLAEFDYSNKPKMTFPFNQAIPRWSMWILKTKILPWLYWNKILKGKA